MRAQKSPHEYGRPASPHAGFDEVAGNVVRKDPIHAVMEIVHTQPPDHRMGYESQIPRRREFLQIAVLIGKQNTVKAAFMFGFGDVIENFSDLLDRNRYLTIVIGDKYTAGRWIPLGFYCLNEAQKLGLTLKSIIIKNMAGNRAKQNKEGIWRYRALSSDYYIFKHEYILIFKK